MTIQRSWQGRAFLGMSLDGYIAGPGGDLSFLESEPGKGQHTEIRSDHPALTWDTFFPTVDALVMGRTTYEKVLTFGEWPYPGMNVIVLSSALESDDPNVAIAHSPEEVIALLNDAGVKNVYVDGGRTVQEFLARGLIDEFTVSILPIVIGDGVRLFGPESRATFAVEGAHIEADGLARITYRVLSNA